VTSEDQAVTSIWRRYAFNKCQGFLGRLFGHKYQARFDVKTPNATIKAYDTAFVKALQTRVYRGDVCKRCGNTVNTK